MDGISARYTDKETKSSLNSAMRSVGANAIPNAGGNSRVESGNVSERLTIKSTMHSTNIPQSFSIFVKSAVLGTIVLGDLTGIRQNIDYGKRANQKLHQWAFSKITSLITYKAKEVGITVRQIGEAYTSQTCPKCGNRKKPANRNYTCKCGFKYHRDGVGAINIRQKYLDRLGDPVVADMAPPLGFRLEVPVVLA